MKAGIEVILIEILYEDKDLIICVKPVGVLSQPGMGEGEDMITLLTEHLAENKEKPYIGLVHRLDRNVGGVMVFSKNKQLLQNYHKQFKREILPKSIWQ